MFLINGKPGEQISVQDRGLHYGDGVFETIAIKETKPLCWDEHYHRLESGCNRLGIACPSSSVLLSELAQLNIDSSLVVLKIIISRGPGGRGYKPLDQPSVTRILGMYPWPDYPEEYYSAGIKIRFCQIRLGHNPELAGIKHLNRLEQVLARNEWNQTEIAEGLMLDIDDNVIEGTMSNLFIIKDRTLMTPDISRCGINGIIRQHILNLGQALELPVTITTVKESDLHNADEIFLCNSVVGIWPVRMLENRTYKPGHWSQIIRDKLIAQKIIAK